MPISIVTPSAVAVMPTADIKLHLRVDHDEDDNYIAALVTAATRHAEEVLSRSLITQTLAMRMDHFPSGRLIEIRRAPLQSVTSIQYVDTAGSTQTFSSSNYFVDIYSTPGRIVLDDTSSWPLVDDRPNAVTVTYVSGYGDDADDVPADIVQAIYLIVGEWYRNRENSAEVSFKDIPFAASALLYPHRACYLG